MVNFGKALAFSLTVVAMGGEVHPPRMFAECSMITDDLLTTRYDTFELVILLDGRVRPKGGGCQLREPFVADIRSTV